MLSGLLKYSVMVSTYGIQPVIPRLVRGGVSSSLTISTRYFCLIVLVGVAFLVAPIFFIFYFDI